MFQTTKDDVIFSGHGATLPEKGRLTHVPEGVEFIMFGPPGTCVTDNLGQMLEGGIYISNLFITSPKTKGRSSLSATKLTYASGGIPNLILAQPRDINVGGQGVVPHIIGVETPTHLQDLWPRLKPFRKAGKILRVIWAACSTIRNTDPTADGE